MPTSPPKTKLSVRFIEGTTSLQREVIVNGLRTFVDNDLTQVIVTQDLVDSTNTAIELLNLFFTLVSIIAVTLCFFVLWLSFTSNVNENSWEFGVLRAVGLTQARTFRLYVYEALSLIISAILLGSSVGILVSITLTLQFNLFTEFPFKFAFPYTLFFVVLAMSLLVAVLGSYLPARLLGKRNIAVALKNK
jgi:ABC-type antimicrobial peptide transport system permease subunit